MNLLKIQDALKNASDDQLMQLMQAPDSSAPSYLVLSEIRRRKDMRAQQPQEPQGTVAEDLASTPQTYDQAGIRSLRTPGYEEEEQPSPDDMQEMREGGVVRMQAGGMAEDFGLLPESEALPSSPFFDRFRRFREETQRLRETNQPASQLPRGGGEFGEERPIEGETRYTPGPSAGIPPCQIIPQSQWVAGRFIKRQPGLLLLLLVAPLAAVVPLVFVALALVAVALKMVCLAVCAALNLLSPTTLPHFVKSLKGAGLILKSGGAKLKTSP